MKTETVAVGVGALVLLTGVLVWWRRRQETAAEPVVAPPVAPPGPAQAALKPQGPATGPVTKLVQKVKDKAQAIVAPKMAATLPKPTSGLAGGLMMAAIRDGTYEPITWTTIDVPAGDGTNLKVEVMSDTFKAKINGLPVRLPMTYGEYQEAARVLAASKGLEIIPPTKDIVDAMEAQASARGHLVPQDTSTMMSLPSAVKFSQGVDAQFAGKDQRLLMGPWKFWVLDKDITTELAPGMFMGRLTPYPKPPRAVNYGGWDKDENGKPIQTIGRWHDAAHYDYSQDGMFAKRWATDSAGNRVDLLDWAEKRQGVSPDATKPFRNSPAVAGADADTEEPADA